MKKPIIDDSKTRLAKIKQLTKQINNTYNTHVKSREKIDWIIKNLKDAVEASKSNLIEKQDLINMIEDIICVVEEEDDNE